MENREQQNWNL